jgi:hypothetical protein
MEVRRVERCSKDCLGEYHCGAGYIEIANIYNQDEYQSYGSKVNTFYHELVHNILFNMGDKLHNNEQFVSTFAGFLTEAMTTADYPAKRH